ncbi:PH domain-containing protein [Salegentibacter sp. BLCTC]|uniref:PH domain-containing protein n=1 Tax=Salegentibacter maritimus TaxID=2794347 RepID=A0ABS0TF86_9FLAO|nr:MULTISPECIES: PH domain-containing protein [Salegentibacter]MBE7639273.1 PH domain-containing protein [Salegentibacter sp. BLCTC]MBI6119721.1 PH domain-containing protein [Salegentibacter maritimus]
MDSLGKDFSNDQIDLASLPKYESVAYSSVSSTYLIKMNIQTGIFMLVLFTILGVLWFFQLNQWQTGILLAVVIAAFIFRFWNNYKLLQSLGYAVREKDIVYKRGFIFNKTTIVPFNRVQHVSISRGVWDKILGISNLNIFTAGGSGSDITIPGLDPKMALQLKEALAVKISKDEF